MRTVTVDDVMAADPCYSRAEVERLFAGREKLSAADVAEIEIPAQDRIWALVFWFLSQDECVEFARWCADQPASATSAASAASAAWAARARMARSVASAASAAWSAASAAWEASAPWATAASAASAAAARAAAREAQIAEALRIIEANDAKKGVGRTMADEDDEMQAHADALAGEASRIREALGLDCVQILVSGAGEDDETFNLSAGSGNWYARVGLCRAFVIRADESQREDVRGIMEGDP